MDVVAKKEYTPRAFFVTVWNQCLRNLGFGEYLTEDDKPKDGTGKKLLELVCNVFEESGKGRKASGSACISPNQGFHLHLGVYSSSPMKYHVVSGILGNAHVEQQRATKERLIEYIKKEGDFEEKGEIVLCVTDNMDGVVGRQGQRSDLQGIREMIESGYTPNEVFDMSIENRKYEKLVKAEYYRKRDKETPPLRDIYVEWHVGESGSGKTYMFPKLCEEHGEDSVYMLSDYDNGGFDCYNGEPILFMDEFRGQLRYSTLLCMLQGYKQQIHARYNNVLSLWNEVYIATVLPPEEVYGNMLDKLEDRKNDTVKQLYRRINNIVYHWGENGEYKSYSMPMSDYVNYANLIQKARQTEDGFVKLTESEMEQVKLWE